MRGENKTMKQRITIVLRDGEEHIFPALSEKARSEGRTIVKQALRYIREGLERDVNPIAEALTIHKGKS